MTEPNATSVGAEFFCTAGHVFELETSPDVEEGIVCPLCGSVETRARMDASIEWEHLRNDATQAEGVAPDNTELKEGARDGTLDEVAANRPLEKVADDRVMEESPVGSPPEEVVDNHTDEEFDQNRTLVEVPSENTVDEFAPNRTQDEFADNRTLDEAADDFVRSLSTSLAVKTLGGAKSETFAETGETPDTEADQNSSGGDAVTEPLRYQLVHVLGRGAFGVVYRVRDESFGRDIAMKRLIRADPARLRSFKREFRTLADIAHPNIAALYDLHSDGEEWSFTMELLDAVEFTEFVWSGFDAKDATCRVPTGRLAGQGPRLSAEATKRLYDALRQLTLGLSALHAAGVLHRDIKPSNVMVTKEGRVVLLDFGLAGQVGAGPGRQLSGTPRYMAPEQAAKRTTSEASDWYAVGVMLYEILTGRPVFEARGIWDLFSKKKTLVPPPPNSHEPSIPDDLNELCVRLLAIDPTQRPNASETLRFLGAESDADSLPDRKFDAARTQVELVGRDSQLQRLRDHYARVSGSDSAEQGAASVFVHGRSGMGKSILIDRFLEELQGDEQALILRGRCYEQESVPFKALDSLVDSLADYLAGLPDKQARELIPEDCRPLAQIFPVLGQIPGMEDAGRPSILNVERQELRQRAMQGLRDLLTQIGQRNSLALYIDDLQWGDVDSARLLVDLVRPPDEPRLLLLGSYRSENRENSPCLMALDAAYESGDVHPPREDIAVEALTLEQSTELALQLLSRTDAGAREMATRVAQESGGWPFFVWELALHAQHDPEIAGRALELDEVIWSRACRLPDETRRLLELVAVAARPIAAQEAWQAINEVDRGQSLLVQLRSASFIRTTESEYGTLIETYHDRIRESVVDRLTKGTVHAYHLSMAATIEALSGITPDDREQWVRDSKAEAIDLTADQWDRVFDLAYHLPRGGRVGHALPYALIAAERARQQDALEVAEQHFRIAARGAADAPDHVRFRVEHGLGQVLLRNGHYDEAEDRMIAARQLADSQLMRAETDCTLGELVLKRGETKRAGHILEEALQDLGQWVPQTTASVVVGVAWQAFVQMLHTVMPRLFVHRLNSELPPAERVRVEMLGHLSYVNWFSKGSLPTLWSQMAQINRAERYLPSPELAWAWSTHAVALSIIPLHKRAIRYGRKSLQTRRMYGNLWGEGQALHFLGVALYAAAEIRECQDVWEEAVDKFEQAGDWWEANFIGFQLSWAYYYLDELEQASAIAERVYYSGSEMGENQAVSISIDCWSLASNGKVPLDVIEAELAREGYDNQGKVQVLLGAGVRHYWLDDQEGALAAFDEALSVIREHALRNVYVAPIFPWRVTVLRTLLSRETPGSPEHRKFMKQATTALRAAIRKGKAFPSQLPHSLREAGEVALLRNQPDKARQFFDQSVAAADRHHLIHQCRLSHERIRELWPNGR